MNEGWWRWRESNSRPKWNQPNVYACSRPLISEEVCRQAGLSPSIRLVRHPAAGRRHSLQRGPMNYASLAIGRPQFDIAAVN